MLPRIAPFDDGNDGDERVYDDPDVFDIDRLPSRLLTSGFGSHHCPGTHLAKAQITIGIGRLISRLPGLTLTNTESAQPCGAILRGPRALEVSW